MINPLNAKNLVRRLFTLILLAAASTIGASAQVSIDQGRGADPRVDYASLTRFGPWDDRNYDLTLKDLSLLAPNEAELRTAIPAFFRVGMRKAWPNLPTTGTAQYPRSALNIFRQMYGGYLIDGKLYRKALRIDDEFQVVLENGMPEADSDATAGNRSVGGEVRVTNPEGAAEAAIKINPADTSIVIAGSNGPGSGQKMHYSSDGGASWTETPLPGGGSCCDPSVDWSSDGSKGYASTLGGCNMSGCGVWFYRSDDNGQTWSGLDSVTPGDSRREITTSGSDKEFIHVDQHPTSPFKDNVYLTWHESNVMQFAVSTDFGNTFTVQSLSSLSENRGIGSDITTDAAGAVYYFWPGTSSRTIRLAKSTDGGVSFAAPAVVANTQASFVFPIPSMETRDVFVYVSADSDRGAGPYSGSVYVAWTDSTGTTSGSVPSSNHARIQVAYSRDGGSSWSVTTPHETADAESVDRWHPWLAVGPDGRVHVVFYDTRRDPARTSVDLFFSSSTDGAQTWSAPQRITSEQSPNIADSFEFGDYNNLDIVLNDLISVYTDNRDESGGSGDSVDVYAAGISFCDQPESPIVSVDGVTPTTVDLDWAPVPGADSYNIYRSASGCGPGSVLIDTTSLTSFSDAGVVAGESYSYVVTSVDNGCESNNGSCVSAVLAPRPTYNGHAFCDGNGDGFADPGETVVMPLTLLNDGDFNASGISATISSSSPGVTVIDGSAFFPDLPPRMSSQSALPHFSWQAAGDIPCGTLVDFTLDIVSSEGTWLDSFQAVIGDAVRATEVANQRNAIALQANSAATVVLDPDPTLPAPASSVAFAAPSLAGYSATNAQALVQVAVVAPGGATRTLKACGEVAQPSYDITGLYNGSSEGPGTWSVCVSTGNATACTGTGCSRQVGPWQDLDVSGATMSVEGAVVTCAPNAGAGSCGPEEISDVSSGEPPLVVGPGSPSTISVEADPLITAYNVYHDAVGDWFSTPQSICSITAWIDNGDGTLTLGVTIPDDSWILVTGSNAAGEGALGASSVVGERSLSGAWNLCGANP